MRAPTAGPSGLTRSALVGRAVRRYAPAGRSGLPHRAGGVRSIVMPSHREDLSRLIAPDYLDGVEKRPVEEIRAMRDECQEAETAVSYLRRLVQGRLDIVHIYLDPPRRSPPTSPRSSRTPRDHAAPGGLPARAACPMLLSPDTEESDLTTSLDEILDAKGIGSLPSTNGRLWQIVEAARDVGAQRLLQPTRVPRRDRQAPGRDRRPVQGGTCLGRRPPLVKEIPDRWQRAGCVHPRAAELGPAVVAAALGARRDLESVSEPDRARAAEALGRDPPADRQGAADLGGDPLRPGRHPRAPEAASTTWPARSWPTPT